MTWRDPATSRMYHLDLVCNKWLTMESHGDGNDNHVYGPNFLLPPF